MLFLYGLDTAGKIRIEGDVILMALKLDKQRPKRHGAVSLKRSIFNKGKKGAL